MTFYGVLFGNGTPNNASQNGTQLIISSTLAGATNSSTGTMSFWYRSPDVVTDSQSGYNYIFNTATGTAAFSMYLNGSVSSLLCDLRNQPTSPTSEFRAQQQRVFLQDQYWHHVLWNWDMNHATGSRIMNFCIDGQLISAGKSSTDTGSAFTVPWSTMNAFVLNDSAWCTFDLAEFWVAPGQFLDVTDPTVIAKFISGGLPVSLGATGSLPTGTAPLIYLTCQTGVATDFMTNQGSGGGGFTLNTTGNYNTALTISSSNPSVETPFVLLTPSTPTLTMRETQYGLNLSSAFSFISGISGNIMIDGDTPMVSLLQDQFNSTDHITPSQASFAALNEDGKTYSTYALGSQVAGTVNSYNVVAQTTNKIFQATAWQNTQGKATLNVNILSKVNPLTFTSYTYAGASAWALSQLNTTNNLLIPGTIVWWGGKEQFVALADMTVNGGNALLIDEAGNWTDAKIWNGFDNWSAYVVQPNNLGFITLVTMPDQANNQNHFFTPPVSLNGNSFVNTCYAVTADTTGTESFRKQIYASDLNVDNTIRYWRSTAPFPESVTVGPQGITFTPYNASPYFIAKLNSSFGTLTSYQVQADSGDATAVAALAATPILGIPYQSSQHTYLAYQTGGGTPTTGILWDGTFTSAQSKQAMMMIN